MLCLFIFSAMSKRCQNLLLQIYLHFPEIIQHVTLPEGTFSSGGAANGTNCKVSWCTRPPSNTCLSLSQRAMRTVGAAFYLLSHKLPSQDDSKLFPSCRKIYVFLSTLSWMCWCTAWSHCWLTLQTPSLPKAVFLMPTLPVGSWLCRTRSCSSGKAWGGLESISGSHPVQPADRPSRSADTCP